MINGIDGLVGKNGIVTKQVQRVTPGIVKAEGDYWSAVTWDQQEIAVDTIVFIIAVEQGHLVVTQDLLNF